MPDLDRLCVRGRLCGLQLGSNEAAPLDIQRQEHAMQPVRHIDSYCLVLLQYGVVACVANANENDARILACLHDHDAGGTPAQRHSESTNIVYQVGILLRAWCMTWRDAMDDCCEVATGPRGSRYTERCRALSQAKFIYNRTYEL